MGALEGTQKRGGKSISRLRAIAYGLRYNVDSGKTSMLARDLQRIEADKDVKIRFVSWQVSCSSQRSERSLWNHHLLD